MGNILQRDAKYSSKRLSGFRKVQSWAANSMDFYSSSSLGSQNISESADLVKTNQDHEAQGQEFQKTMFRPILRLRLVLKSTSLQIIIYYSPFKISGIFIFPVQV